MNNRLCSCSWIIWLKYIQLTTKTIELEVVINYRLREKFEDTKGTIGRRNSEEGQITQCPNEKGQNDKQW
jgi:hypothetical protein